MSRVSMFPWKALKFESKEDNKKSLAFGHRQASMGEMLASLSTELTNNKKQNSKRKRNLPLESDLK